MLIAEEFLLLSLDDTTGRRSIGSEKIDPALGAAVLVELALLERISITGDEQGLAQRRRVKIVSTKPTDDPVLDEALAYVESREGKRVKDLINPYAWKPMTKGLRDRLLRQLVARGVLTRQQDTVLGVFPVTRWPTADVRAEAEVIERLRSALVDGLTPTERTVALVGLLHATGHLGRVLPGEDKALVKQRAKTMTDGDWAARAVKQVIGEIQSSGAAAVV